MIVSGTETKSTQPTMNTATAVFMVSRKPCSGSNGIRVHDPPECVFTIDRNTQPGPELALHRPEQEAAQTELLEAPSVTERRLRARLGEMVAAQAVEAEAGRAGLRGGVTGPGLYHRYNAALKRVSGNKSRAEMTLAELEAAVGWLERNRLSEHLHLLDDDARYAWVARQRGEWKPPVGRVTQLNRRPRPTNPTS
jgi:hypothetical protein